MFSIIIPLYNKALYIEKAIQSVLAQTCKEFELIVLDDGSTDNSLKIVTDIDFSGYAVKIVSQENQGVSATRNNGVKIAKYENIAFLDADDWWEADFLKSMKNLMENYPNAGVYASSYYIVKRGQKKTAPVGVDEGFAQGGIDYCKVYANTLCMPVWTGATIVPKLVFNEMGGFKTRLTLGEDFDLWIRIALKYPVVFFNKPQSNYNQDVDVYNRGVAKDKIFIPETFMTFNFDFLKEEEQNNKNLKILLDRLRVHSLLRYRIQNAYPEEVRKVISKVNFDNVEKKYFYIYTYPLFLIRVWYNLLKTASIIKNNIK